MAQLGLSTSLLTALPSEEAAELVAANTTTGRLLKHRRPDPRRPEGRGY